MLKAIEKSRNTRLERMLLLSGLIIILSILSVFLFMKCTTDVEPAYVFSVVSLVANVGVAFLVLSYTTDSISMSEVKSEQYIAPNLLSDSRKKEVENSIVLKTELIEINDKSSNTQKSNERDVKLMVFRNYGKSPVLNASLKLKSTDCNFNINKVSSYNVASNEQLVIRFEYPRYLNKTVQTIELVIEYKDYLDVSYRQIIHLEYLDGNFIYKIKRPESVNAKM